MRQLWRTPYTPLIFEPPPNPMGTVLSGAGSAGIAPVPFLIYCVTDRGLERDSPSVVALTIEPDGEPGHEPLSSHSLA